MHRKVLVVEQADTMRTVAETVLRQNGYEVIAVAAADKAREVLELSRPDLIIVGADITTPEGAPFYERLQLDDNTRAIPLLLFESSDKAAVDFPSEVVIPRPFDPRDFVNKVAVFIGKGENRTMTSNPLGESPIDDAVLEEMDKTTVGRRQATAITRSRTTGLDAVAEKERELSETSKVESIMIGEEDSKIIRESERKRAKPPEGTGKLEILTDQYGLTDPGAGPDLETEDEVHDYDWFIQSIRTDAEATPTPHTKKPARSGDSSKLTIQEASSVVDPHTPAPSSPTPSVAESGPGVEKFIDEFKREMEEMRGEDAEDLMVAPERKKADASGDALNWEDKVEKLTP
jgi:DNA-binding response OmpR family regulator